MGSKNENGRSIGSHELPPGFTWQEFPAVKARFPIPEGWHSREGSEGDTRAYFITREPIEKTGLFVTGLTVNAFLNIEAKVRMTPSVFARNFMTTQREMTPLGEIVTIDDCPFKTYRRYFQVQRAAGMGVRPINLYTEATGNDRTGTAYIMLFESPLSKWSQDAMIGETIINNRILDESV